MTEAASSSPAPPQLSDILDTRYFLLRVCTRGWLVLGIAALSGLLVGLIVILKTPSYEATAIVRIKPDTSQGQATTSLTAEASLLQSRRLVEDVLHKLDRPLDVRYRPAYYGERIETFFSILSYRLREKKAPEWLTLTPSLIVRHFRASENFYGEQLTLRLTEADTFNVLDKNNVSLGSGSLGIPVTLETAQGHIDMLLERPQNAPSLCQSFDFYPRSAHFFADKVLENIKVQETRFAQSGGTLTLTFQSKDPYFAKQFVQTLLESYIGTTLEDNRNAPKQVLDYLTAEVVRLEQRLTEARAELLSRRMLFQSIDIPTEARLSLEQLAKLQSDLLGVEQERRKIAFSLAPDNSVLGAIDDQIKLIKKEIKKNQSVIDGIPVAQMEILRLERDIDLMANLLERTRDEQRKAATELKGITKHVEVLQFPTLTRGIKLKETALLMLITASIVSMTGFLYLLFGAIPAFARVTSQRQLEQFKDAVFLRVLPRSQKHFTDVAESLASHSDMMVVQDVKSKILLVTSLSPLKTSFCLGSEIALGIARSHRVLFIDADIKKSSAEKGLTDVLLASYDISEALREKTDNITVLFSGTATPGYNLLHRNGGKVPKLITALSQKFQTTLVSWPALTDTAANLELLKFAHAVIIIVQYGDKLPVLRQMVDSLSRAGVSPLYLVLQK